MTGSNTTIPSTTKELLDTLARVRGTARMRLHLLSLEAKDRLKQLEARVESMQSHLESGAEQTAALGIREITDAVLDLLSAHPVASLQTSARDLMRPVQSCTPSDNLSRAAQLMWELDCGFVPVCDRGGNLVGVVTDRDVCMATYTRGQLLSDIPVWSTMTTQVASIAANATLSDVLRLMRERQIRRVPVVDGEKLLGAITLADVALYLDVHEGATAGAVDLGMTLAAISAPRSPKSPGPAE